jgi:hypothetical protein
MVNNTTNRHSRSGTQKFLENLYPDYSGIFPFGQTTFSSNSQ